MKIKIKETGNYGTLSIIDPKTGIDWTQDLMGNHGALPDCGDDNIYIMTQENFEWWYNLIIEYQNADDKYNELLNDIDDTELLETAAANISGDLEDYPAALNEVCNEYDKNN